MKLGLMLPYAGQQLSLPMPLIQQAEQLGFDSVWVSEVYGADAISQASWILAKTSKIKVGTAIMQVPARTPALAAMTAMSLSQLSRGRFIVGLGASGPQVVEGWHGVAYAKAITRNREYIQIMRKIMAREQALSFEGKLYHIPAQGEGCTGLGKPLKSLLAADQGIPIYSAAITPAGLAVAAELADGLLPVWMNPERPELITQHLLKGFAAAEGNKQLAEFSIAPGLMVVMGTDLQQCRLPVKQMLALYVGGMGAKAKNFYADYIASMGYVEAARQIQNLYLAGDKQQAAAAVPDQLVDEIALVGDEQRIRQQALRWQQSEQQGLVDTLLIQTEQAAVLPLLADIFLP